MFEEYTQDYLLSLMLNEGKKLDVSVQEGSLVYNASALMAVMLEDAYDKAEELYINSFADTCDREHLLRMGRARGLEPKAAVKTVVEIKSDSNTLKDLTLENESGDFVATKLKAQDITNGVYTYEAEAVEGGYIEIRNTSFYPIDAPDNFGYAELSKVITEGKPEEETEAFRQRFFDSFTLPGQFGNEKYYRDLALSVEGVKACNIEVHSSNLESILIQYMDENAQSPTELGMKIKSEIGDKVCVGQVIDTSPPQGLINSGNVISNLSLSVILSKDTVSSEVKGSIIDTLKAYMTEINLTGFGKEGGIYFKGYEFSRRCENIDGVVDVDVEGVTLTGGTAQKIVNIPKNSKIELPENLDGTVSFTFTSEV